MDNTCSISKIRDLLAGNHAGGELLDRVSAEKIAMDYFSRRFPEGAHLLIFGSAANNSMTPLSDIDLGIILPGNQRYKRQKVLYKNFLLDVASISDSQLERHLWSSRANGAAVDILAFAYGRLVSGDPALIAIIQERLQSIIAKGPLPADDVESNKVRASMTALLLDLKSSRSRAESLSIVLDIYPLLRRAIELGVPAWRAGGRWAALLFEEHIEGGFTALISALLDDQQNRHQDFQAICLTALDRLGGPLWGIGA